MNESSSRLLEQNPDAIAYHLMEKAEYRDGLQEIAIGLTILVFAGMTGSDLLFKPGSFGMNASLWGAVLLMPIVSFGSQWAIKKVRKRFLIGKIGYVKLKPVNRKQAGIRLGIITGLACAIAVLAAFAMFKVVTANHSGVGLALGSLFPFSGWAFVGMGIVGGAVMVFRVYLLRYAIGGAIMATMGILLAFSGVSLALGLTILYAYAGLLALISGCVVFFLVLRQPAESGELR
ncbi:MAG: hypothetical protein ABSG51_06900 [Terracidiphilus sp.]